PCAADRAALLRLPGYACVTGLLADGSLPAVRLRTEIGRRASAALGLRDDAEAFFADAIAKGGIRIAVPLARALRRLRRAEEDRTTAGQETDDERSNGDGPHDQNASSRPARPSPACTDGASRFGSRSVR